MVVRPLKNLHLVYECRTVPGFGTGALRKWRPDQEPCHAGFESLPYFLQDSDRVSATKGPEGLPKDLPGLSRYPVSTVTGACCYKHLTAYNTVHRQGESPWSPSTIIRVCDVRPN